MSRLFSRFRDQTGASLVEYALIASLIAIPSAATLSAISTTMNEEFNAIEDNAASSGHGASTTAAPPTTSAGGGGTPTTTTTTTVAPTTTTAAPTTTTTVPPTTTTAVPPTTTTAAPPTTTTSPPPPTTTTIPGAPAFQSERVDTNGGWLEFELENGEINLVDYNLERKWRGNLTRNPDGSLTVHLWKNNGNKHVWVHAYVDSTGHLIVTVS